jgi:hypothetical protein
MFTEPLLRNGRCIFDYCVATSVHATIFYPCLKYISYYSYLCVFFLASYLRILFRIPWNFSIAKVFWIQIKLGNSECDYRLFAFLLSLFLLKTSYESWHELSSHLLEINWRLLGFFDAASSRYVQFSYKTMTETNWLEEVIWWLVG